MIICSLYVNTFVFIQLVYDYNITLKEPYKFLSIPLIFFSYVVLVVLLDSLDSVAEVNLDEQDRATKPEALPEMADDEMTGTGKGGQLAVL